MDRVTPSIQRAAERDRHDPDSIAEVHVERTIELILETDPEIAELVAAGRCAVVGLVYRLDEGRVRVVASEPATLG